jgi:putative DNA primase/helicase
VTAPHSRAELNALIERARRTDILDLATRRLGAKLTKIAPNEWAGPCLHCGGRDRFAVNTVKQLFNCRGCATGGDAIALVGLGLDLDFLGAVGFIAGESSTSTRKSDGGQAAYEPRANDDRAAAAQAHKPSNFWRTIWRESRALIGTPAEIYLERRGLPRPYPASLRFHPRLKSIDHDKKPRPPSPALVGLIERFDPIGRVEAIGVTATLVTTGGCKAFADDPRRFHGSRVGGGVWFIEPTLDRAALAEVQLAYEDELIVGEGIESTSSAMRLWSARSGVAALCAGGLGSLTLPPAFCRVRIAADYDLNEAGQDAAVEAAGA